jgi:pyruvate/2-oxoglutarate dehydrogenase complex dihydrolipoamide acyltransferase (E2) component
MSMTEGVLIEWLIPDGGEVKEGQPIYVLETAKSALEIESPASGRITHKVSAGETYPVGAEIGEIS